MRGVVARDGEEDLVEGRLGDAHRVDRHRGLAQGTPDELKGSVGNSTLQLQLAAGSDQALACDVVRRVLGSEPVLTPESGRINAPLVVADRAADVLIALREAAVAIDSVSVAKPTLDEVFLAITGHDATEDDQKPDSNEYDTPALEVAR